MNNRVIKSELVSINNFAGSLKRTLNIIAFKSAHNNFNILNYQPESLSKIS
jgi:hypothetical protein